MCKYKYIPYDGGRESNKQPFVQLILFSVNYIDIRKIDKLDLLIRSVDTVSICCYREDRGRRKRMKKKEEEEERGGRRKRRKRKRWTYPES